MGDAVLGNSRITDTKVVSARDNGVFGLNWGTPVNLIEHYAAIITVLQDVMPIDAYRFLIEPPQSPQTQEASVDTIF